MPEFHCPLKVFLSYASQDKPSVRELSVHLAGEGWIDTWQDEKNLLPGQDWRVKIEEAVEDADVVIIVLSQHSVSKEGYVQKELRYAREIALEKPEDAIFLIPLRLDECEVPRGLRFYQWVDYFDDKKDASYLALVASLKIRYEQKLKVEEEERLRRGQQEREAAEKATRETSEQVAAEQTRLKAQEEEQQRIAKQKAELEAAERVAREKTEKEALARQAARMEAFAKFLERTRQNLTRIMLYFRWIGLFALIGLVIWGAIVGVPKLFPVPTETPVVAKTATSTHISPTKTLVPTATKTKIPTATSRPTTFSMYDDFPINLNFDYNKDLWSGSGDKIKLQEGYLKFSGTDSGTELRPRGPSVWKITQIGTLQADLRIDNVTGTSYAFTKLGIDTTLSDGKGVWWAQCRVGSFDGVNAQIICDSYRWGDGPEILYQTTSYPIEFGKFYSVAIDLAPDGSNVRYSVDGQEIGSYAPDVKSLLEKAGFSWSIGIYIEEGSSADGAIDNVMVGPN
ncbi:MAG: TIR domain-containing protein [Anaerolineales bacterium]|nr:TIR domain-containing protein [Anaerolineales bacterium]